MGYEPWSSSPAARAAMVGNVSRDTRPELALRRRVHALGLRYRVHSPLPLAGVRRRADLSFPKERVAVMVDGCLWHGCPDHCRTPSRQSEYWTNKIHRNRKRDQDTDRRLQEQGWAVLRIWEHESVDDAAEKVRLLVLSRRALKHAEAVSWGG